MLKNNPNCLLSTGSEAVITEKAASLRSWQSKDAKEKYARTHKGNLSYVQVNLIHCKCHCRWSFSRRVQEQTGPGGWALCRQDASSEETYCKDFNWCSFFRSVGDLLARQIGPVDSLQWRKCFDPLGAWNSSIKPQTTYASVNFFVLFPSSGRNS